MRGLSLTQPWATLVAIGAKQIETRSWRTSYRGPVAIHAALKFPKECKDLIFTEPFNSALQRIETNSKGLKDLPRGVIIAVCDVTAVCFIDTERREDGVPSILLGGNYRIIVGKERAFGDYSNGRFAWILENLRVLKEPIPCKGALSLWDVPLNVESLIWEQLQ